jgi:hypothetical protein
MATLQDPQPASTADQSGSEIRLHAAVYQKGEGEDLRWVGICLEHIVWSKARTREAVLEDLQRQIQAYLRWGQEDGKEPFAHLPRATKRSWDKYRAGTAERFEFVIRPTPSPVLPVIELRAAA